MGNKEALLESALASLVEKGYAATTARDVAGRAGTSLAAIGYHFGSTQQLLHEAIAEGFGLWRRQIAEVLEANAGRPLDDVLQAVGDQMTVLFREQRPLLTVFLDAVALGERAPELREHAAALYAEERVGIAALLRLLRREERGDEDVVAAVIQAVLDGMIVQTVIREEGAPAVRDFLEVLRPLVIGSVRAGGDA